MYQENWKWCGQCQGFFFSGNGPGVCPATTVGHNDAGSSDYTLVTSDSGQSGQSDWKWCNKCQGLFFAGNNTLGACPATGAHNDTGSSDYLLATSGSGQGNWKWCSQCQGLFFAGGNTLGVCPAAKTPEGPHTDAGSGDYAMFYLGGQSNFILADVDCQPLHDIAVTINVTQDMVVESADGPTKGFAFQLNAWSPKGATIAWQQYALILWDSDQSGWKWCNKCQGLFFSGSGPGVCPAGGAHTDAGSGDYCLGQGDDDLAASSGGQSDWKWCNKCQGLFFSGGNTLGVCPATGAHNDAGSGDYLLAMSGGGQSDWKWCNKCQGLFFSGNNTLGACPATGAHNDTGSGDYTLTTSSNGQITGMVDNWDVNLSGDGTVNDSFSVASLPSHTVPAGSELLISLENDVDGNITGVGFSVFELEAKGGVVSLKQVGKVTRTLLSIPGTTSADLAPIVAFQLNLVGPINTESAVLSSGAGTITYSATTDGLTPLTQVPACSASSATTGEQANSFYGVLPDILNNTFTQSFNVSTAMPMIRAAGKPRPETRIPVP